MTKTIPPFSLAAMALAGLLLQGLPAQAQEVRNLDLQGVPPDLIEDGAAPSPSMAPPTARQVANVDLGENPSSTGAGPGLSPAVTGPSARAQAAASAGPAAAAAAARSGALRRVASRDVVAGGVERAVFSREPVRVTLPVGRERLITLPAPAALHVPKDIEMVARLEVIDRTLYATALVPFTPLRIVAELVDTGQQIPLDLVANAGTTATAGELEVSVFDPMARPTARTSTGSSDSGEREAPQASADMVQLTRYAARQLYAPRRLASGDANVHQVGVRTSVVAGLLRGANVETAPLGQWKSGNLYVTAVRVTNKSRFPLELPLENIRGNWIAATAQHGRIGPAGSETDTTSIYLVSDRAFEASL